jgi:hypothetical protein
VQNWIEGVKYNSQNHEQKLTYYFLGTRLKLKENLMKDGGIETGRGKGWIAAAIPKNRCVSFEEFLKHSNLTK